MVRAAVPPSGFTDGEYGEFSDHIPIPQTVFMLGSMDR